MTVQLLLNEDQFQRAEVEIARDDVFSVSAFRDPSGCAAVRISNDRGHIVARLFKLDPLDLPDGRSRCLGHGAALDVTRSWQNRRDRGRPLYHCGPAPDMERLDAPRPVARGGVGR